MPLNDPRRTSDVDREGGNASANRRWLQRVRPYLLHTWKGKNLVEPTL